MTVEELTIKISADTENFKKAVDEANKAMEDLKSTAADAGRQVTQAFQGLIGTDITASVSAEDNRPEGNAVGVSEMQSDNSPKNSEPSGIVADNTGTVSAGRFEDNAAAAVVTNDSNAAQPPVFTAGRSIAEDSIVQAEAPSTEGFMQYYERVNNVGAAAGVLDLRENETVIGAVNDRGYADNIPVTLNTTVELDGDKIGESVGNYFIRRNRITNGTEE